MGPNRHPLVSVVMAVRDGARYVGSALSSATAQEWPNLELIVVDDGSTDATVDVIDSLGDPRIRVIRQENTGVARARNVGIEHARGEYVAFLDADDFWLPTKTALQVEVFSRRPEVGLVHGTYVVADEGLRPRRIVRAGFRGVDAEKLLLTEADAIALAATGMVRTAVLREVGGFDVSLSTAADVDLVWRISRRYEIASVDAALAYYRMHGAQMHLDLDAFERDVERIYDKSLSAGRRTKQRRARANLHTRIAVQALRVADLRRALRSLGIVLSTRPDRLLLLPLGAVVRRVRNRVSTIGRRRQLPAGVGQQASELTEVAGSRHDR